MIVPMKKATIIIQDKDAGRTVEKLASLGALHIEHHVQPAGGDITSVREDISLLNFAILILSKTEFLSKQNNQTCPPLNDWRQAAKKISDAYKRIEHLKEFSVALSAQIEYWKPWGDFDPETINGLNEKDLFVKLFEIPRQAFKNLPAGLVVEKIFSSKGIIGCVVISQAPFDLSFKELELPKMSPAQMRKRLAEDRRTISFLEGIIMQHTCYNRTLVSALFSLNNILTLHEARAGMGREQEISYISGYIPDDAVLQFKDAAKQERWGVVINDPGPDDNIPTLIRNPRWVRLIQPLLKLLEVLPGYHEIDITPLFLIFFSLFFGMIIGDAGYGLIYLMLTVFVHKKYGTRIRNKNAIFLFYILCSCAIMWGILTATFFGQEWLADAGVKPLIPALNDINFIQAFCFLIGAIHLSIAHIWRTIIKLPHLSSLAEIGWISVIWAAFFLAKMLLLGEAFPFFGKWLIVAGLLLVLFFTSPQRNILRAIGEGLVTIALGLMNNFTDIVSYVRLFAVGLAGIAIADAFNAMAHGIFISGIAGAIAAALVLFAGHTLNILLGPISVLVHGVRLNVLEFSSHAGVTWSGFEYKPLKKHENIKQ